MASASASVVNRLLAALPSRERNKILEHSETVELSFGTILCEPEQAFQYIYFPLTGFISLVATVANHQPLEMGLIGYEGMLGATMVLESNAAPLRAVVQGTGTALRMSAGQFRRLLRDSPVLLRTLKHYLYVLMTQLSQTAICTHFHEVEARLARWLLMTHDRAHADHFHLTHQFLADMLGVRRSGVTVAAGILQRKRLISYTRGEITVLNRHGLEAASCACYRELVDDYSVVLNKR